jgi:hypothetical protein
LCPGGTIIQSGMKSFWNGNLKIAVFNLVIVALALTLPRLGEVVFPCVQEPSATYDCDDETLDMYHHFHSLGIDSVPIVGNLEKTGERYGESDHVWLLVRLGGRYVAYDWGSPRFDPQHYEGYTISLEYLVYAIEQDHKGNDIVAGAER